MQHLQPNTTLQGGKYRIEQKLGQGGFGITYLAIQSGLERNVAIKEFFMKELCVRDESTSHVTLGTEGSREMVSRFREKFLKEARNIAKLNHPNIVRIIDVFEENGTAYYVMEYAEGGSLATKIDSEGYLSEPVATRYILQVANALDYIHQKKMNHLDVKPANIMLNEKDEVVLIDFGLSKQYDGTTGKQTSTTPVGISEGYAPMEQYKQGGVGSFSPETDIYSLGSTFFKMLTGVTPPSASDIYEDGVPIESLKTKGVSQTAIDVICKAMEGRKKDRLKEVHTFIDTLNGKENTPSGKSDSPVGKPKTIAPQTIQSGDETIVGKIVKPDPKPTPTHAPKPEPLKPTVTSNNDDDNNGAKPVEKAIDNKRVINYLPSPIKKMWVTIVAIITSVCILLLMLPYFYEYSAVVFYTHMFGISALLFLVFLATYKITKVPSFLLLLSLITFLINRIVYIPYSFYLTKAILFVYGITIFVSYLGRIKKMGFVIAVYSIIIILLTLMAEDFSNICIYNSVVDAAISWSIDFLLVYIIWWMLTRKEDTIKLLQ